MMTVAILVDWINNASSIDDENISLTTLIGIRHTLFIEGDSTWLS